MKDGKNMRKKLIAAMMAGVLSDRNAQHRSFRSRYRLKR